MERARALVAAGLFTEADRELAYAAEQSAAQRLSHIYADAVQVRAEAALLGGPGAGRRAVGAGGPDPVPGPGQRPTRRALVYSSNSALTWPWRRSQRAAIAARGQSLARRLSLLGLPEDARVASLVAARALISAGRPARAARAAARYGPPGRVDRLDTRLLWRLARSELAAAAGQAGRGLPAPARRNGRAAPAPHPVRLP